MTVMIINGRNEFYEYETSAMTISDSSKKEAISIAT